MGMKQRHQLFFMIASMFMPLTFYAEALGDGGGKRVSDDSRTVKAMLTGRQKLRSGVVRIEEKPAVGQATTFLVAFDYDAGNIRFDGQLPGNRTIRILSTPAGVWFKEPHVKAVQQKKSGEWPSIGEWKYIDPRILGIGAFGEHSTRISYGELSDLLSRSDASEAISDQRVLDALHIATTIPLKTQATTRARRIDHYWVDATRDFVPVRHEVHSQVYDPRTKSWRVSQFDSNVTTEWTERNQVFVPRSIAISRESPKNDPCLIYSMDWESVNEPVAAGMFDEKSLAP